MQTKHFQELKKSGIQQNSQLLQECFEIYMQLQGAKMTRKKLNILQDEHESFSQSKTTQNKFHALLNQYFQAQLQIRGLDQSCLQRKFINSCPQIHQEEYKMTQLVNLNEEISTKHQEMTQKQENYKKLMKKHYKFVSPNKPEEIFHKFFKDKLIKNISNLEHQIREVYQIGGGRSSISSSSYGDNYAVHDRIYQEKQEKLLKEQEKLIEEIKLLEKQVLQIQ